MLWNSLMGGMAVPSSSVTTKRPTKSTNDPVLIRLTDLGIRLVDAEVVEEKHEK